MTSLQQQVTRFIQGQQVLNQEKQHQTCLSVK